MTTMPWTWFGRMSQTSAAVRVTLGVNEPVWQLGDAVVTTSVVRFEWRNVMILPGLYVLFAGPSITTGVVAHLTDPAGQPAANPTYAVPAAAKR